MIALLRRDLALAVRAGGGFGLALVFFLIVVTLVPFAVGPGQVQLAAIGVLGVGVQWIAWRLRIPAIVLMLGLGLLAGPILGLLEPKAALGDLVK